MNRLLEAGGSCGATWGSPVPASLSPSMSLGHPVSCRRSRRHLPATMLSSLEADPTSMVFWWTRSGVRHHVRLTGVRDASSHGSTARMSAAGSALLIPNHPGTQAYLGHPAAHRHLITNRKKKINIIKDNNHKRKIYCRKAAEQAEGKGKCSLLSLCSGGTDFPFLMGSSA